MDCPHSTPEQWQECRNPNRPILAGEVEWKGRRFAGNQGTRRTGRCAAGALRVFASFGRSLPALWATGHTTATTKYFLHVCLYSRSSRLLWRSGNARQNRMDEGRGVGAGFPNQDSPDVGVLENRWIASEGLSKDPKPSTDRDVRCAMLLWWMGGNLDADRARSGDTVVRISTSAW
jgi:hypothetical protein